MVKAFGFFLFTLTLVHVLANRVYPPTKVIKLALAVSKATYLPITTKRFIKDGAIIENPSSLVPAFMLLGIIPFPPKYNPSQDKPACSIKEWTAKSHVNKETEVLMFTNVQQKLVVFGFRGTEPLNVRDWLGNFNLLPGTLTIGKTTISTHRGFRLRYGYIAQWFEAEYLKIPQSYSIVITGHSLGAAEATIAAIFAAGKLNRRPDAVVTYGSPYPGLLSLKKYYNQMVGCNRTVRMTAKCDPFTRVPMTVPGYIHVCDGVEVNGRIGLSFIKAHVLYQGYERGIQNKYSDVNAINFGCDQVLN